MLLPSPAHRNFLHYLPLPFSAWLAGYWHMECSLYWKWQRPRKNPHIPLATNWIFYCIIIKFLLHLATEVLNLSATELILIHLKQWRKEWNIFGASTVCQTLHTQYFIYSLEQTYELAKRGPIPWWGNWCLS